MKKFSSEKIVKIYAQIVKLYNSVSKFIVISKIEVSLETYSTIFFFRYFIVTLNIIVKTTEIQEIPTFCNLTLIQLKVQ